MTRIVVSAFLTVSLLSFFSCKEEEKSFNLIMAEPNPEEALSARMDKVFIQKVEELSGGKIKIQLNVNGILGDNNDVLAIMSKPDSEIQLARISPATLVSYHCTKHELLDIPYTFRSHSHFWKFSSSKIANEILNEPYEKKVGVKGLFFAEEGFRHFFSTKQLVTTEDFRNKKMRTAGNVIMQEIAKSFGCEPVFVNFTYLYSDLQTGKVDIAEQPIANYYSNHFNKVAPYMILDGHQLGLMEVVISSQLWDSLSDRQKEIMETAGKFASKYCYESARDAENQARKMLENDGAIFTEVENIGEWQKSCANIINSTEKADTVLYGEIIKLAD